MNSAGTAQGNAGCSAEKSAGGRCGHPIVNKDGLCSAHSGQNMRAIAQKGGLRPAGSKALNKVLSKDDPLRDKARQELEKLLDDENPQIRLRAAASLFGYGVDKPDSERRKKGWNHEAHAGHPIAEVAAHMAEILDIEPGRLNLLPSPGEVYDTEVNDERANLEGDTRDDQHGESGKP